MLHRDDGVEVLVAKDAGSAGGDVLVRQRIGRWEVGLRLRGDDTRIARRLGFLRKKHHRPNVGRTCNCYRNQLVDGQALGWLGSDDRSGLIEAICAVRAGHGNLLPILLTEPQMGKTVPHGPAHISSFDRRSQIMISPPVTGMTAAVM